MDAMNNISHVDSFMSQIDLIESDEDAKDFLKKYHELHELGGEELGNFLVYLSWGWANNEYLLEAFKNHLSECQHCLLTMNKCKVVNESCIDVDLEIIKKVWVEKFLKQAQQLQSNADSIGAVKCLTNVNFFCPDDERVINLLNTLKDQTETFPDIMNRVKVLLDPIRLKNDQDAKAYIKSINEGKHSRKEVIELLDSMFFFASRNYKSSYAPQCIQLINNAGEIFFSLGEANKALKAYMILEKISPEDVSILITLGILYVQLEEYEKAKKVLIKANRLEPNNLEILYNLGSLYLKLEEYEKAKKVLIKANRLEPNNLDILSHLGSLYLKLEEYEKARNSLERAEEESPTDPYILNALGELHYREGDISESRKFIERAYTADPTNVQIQHNRDIIFGKKRGELLPLDLQPDTLELTMH